MSQRPAAFIDRDGVLNHRIPGDTYVTCPAELVVLPHAAEALATLEDRGYTIVVITNQRGIGRGLMTEEDLDAIHTDLQTALPGIAAIYHCPHDRDAGCSCRKPEPGMILRAAREHDLDLARSILIGDSERDVEAGRRAGVGVCLQMPSDGDLREAVARLPAPD